MRENYDGHPVQAGLAPEQPRSQQMIGFVTGVVVARRCVDEPGNRMRNCTEYDVRDVATGQVYHHAVALQNSQGVENGEEVTYKPATKSLLSRAFGMFTRANDSNGDLVLLGFVGGSRDRPVILGSLAHQRARYAAKKEDGERRFVVHQGTTVEMRDDGSSVLTRNGSTVTVTPDGDVRVDHRSGSRVHCDGDQVKLDGRAVEGVLLGFSAEEQVIRGTSFNATVAEPKVLADAETNVALAGYVADLGLPASAAVPVTRGELAALIAILVTYVTQDATAFGAVAATLSAKVRTE